MNTPWWKFWNPGSGVIGGLIAGVLVGALLIGLALVLFDMGWDAWGI